MFPSPIEIEIAERESRRDRRRGRAAAAARRRAWLLAELADAEVGGRVADVIRWRDEIAALDAAGSPAKGRR